MAVVNWLFVISVLFEEMRSVVRLRIQTPKRVPCNSQCFDSDCDSAEFLAMQGRIIEFLPAAEYSFVGLMEKLGGFISIFFVQRLDEHFLPRSEM